MGGAVPGLAAEMDASALLNEEGGWDFAGRLKQEDTRIPIEYRFGPAADQPPDSVHEIRRELGWEDAEILLVARGACAAPEVGLENEAMIGSVDRFDGQLRLLLFSEEKPGLGFTVLVVDTERGTLIGGDEDWWVGQKPVLKLQLVGMVSSPASPPASPVAEKPEALPAPRLVKLDGSQPHPMFGDLAFEVLFTSYNSGKEITLKQVRYPPESALLRGVHAWQVLQNRPIGELHEPIAQATVCSCHMGTMIVKEFHTVIEIFGVLLHLEEQDCHDVLIVPQSNLNVKCLRGTLDSSMLTESAINILSIIEI